MKANTLPQRIRAIVYSVALRVYAQQATLSAIVVAAYIHARIEIGNFFFRKSVSDTARVFENELYFAEDYVDPTYASTPLYVTFGKVVTDTVAVSDNAVFVIS